MHEGVDQIVVIIVVADDDDDNNHQLLSAFLPYGSQKGLWYKLNRTKYIHYIKKTHKLNSEFKTASRLKTNKHTNLN